VETQHAVAELDLAPRSASPRIRCETLAVIADYWALTKPEVNFLILVTTFAGFYLASQPGAGGFGYFLALQTLLGTLLVASGTATLNQFIERVFDAQMRRTARRPVVTGRIESSHALWFGISLSLAGTAYLALAVGVLASLLAVVTLLSYLFVYTPVKRRTPLCTLIGAFPGAVPPLIGWAAARGRLDLEAWVLYVIVFLWQFPHFMAIAWMYRDDYARAGYLVLPLDARRDRFVKWQSLGASLALIPLSLFPAFTGGAGSIYCVGAVILSSIFVYFSARFAVQRSNSAARQLLLASIVDLPVVFILMMLARK
jgi:protoheme IX farnesyltransferase